MVALYPSPGEVREEENAQTFLDINHVLESDQGPTTLTSGRVEGGPLMFPEPSLG